jgi:hypothetical protein
MAFTMAIFAWSKIGLPAKRAFSWIKGDISKAGSMAIKIAVISVHPERLNSLN